MIAKHIVPVLVACGVAAIGAMGTTLADAAEASHQATSQATHQAARPATHKQPQYNIDLPRDPFTQGARYDVSPSAQGRFILTGQDLTGVSAPPGNAPA